MFGNTIADTLHSLHNRHPLPNRSRRRDQSCRGFLQKLPGHSCTSPGALYQLTILLPDKLPDLDTIGVRHFSFYIKKLELSLKIRVIPTFLFYSVRTAEPKQALGREKCEIGHSYRSGNQCHPMIGSYLNEQTDYD